MKRVVKNLLSSLVISLVFASMTSLVFFDVMKHVINKENFTKSIQQFNINDILNTNLEQYEDYLNEYNNSTNLLDDTTLSSTSFSKEDINNILSSDEYADLLSSYIVDGDIFSNINDLEDINTEELLENVSDEDIRELLKELGVDYNESDIEYLTNTVPAVAPTVVGQVGSNLTPSSGGLNLGMFTELFSDKTLYMGWIFLIICVVGLVLIHREKYQFSIILAIVTGTMAIGIKIILKVLNKGVEAIPKEIMPTVDIFIKPLDECLNKDFSILLVATVILIGIYVLLNFVITQTSIGSPFEFLHLANGILDDDEDGDMNSEDDFSDIDLSSIQVTDINKEIDDFF